jgi:hypothetical protein
VVSKILKGKVKMKEINWCDVGTTNNWSIKKSVEMLKNKNKKLLNFLYNNYLKTKDEEYFYSNSINLLIIINNEINLQISDKYKGSYNLTYEEYERKITETKWCSLEMLIEILYKCISKMNPLSKQFSEFFFAAISNFTMNIIDNIKHKKNLNMPKEISIDEDETILNNYFEDNKFDSIIEKINFRSIFNEQEYQIIYLLSSGFNKSEISEKIKTSRSQVDRKIKKILKMLGESYDDKL